MVGAIEEVVKKARRAFLAFVGKSGTMYNGRIKADKESE